MGLTNFGASFIGQNVEYVNGFTFDNIYSMLLVEYGIVILVWSLRLTLNWALSFKNLTKQDWRYEMFKEKVDKVKYPNVKQEYRFELQELKSNAGFVEPTYNL